MIAQTASRAETLLRSVLGGLAAAVTETVHVIQYARMLRVLTEMSDGELARLGIARADIPAHAERLLGRRG